MKFIELTDKLKKEFHPTKNGILHSNHNKFLVSNKLWWLCPNTCSDGCLHEWEATIHNRMYLNTGCPYCAPNPTKTCIHTSILVTHPIISNEWHPTRNNDLKPENVRYSSNKKVWWLCPNTCPEGCLHEWEATIGDRSMGGNCPYCQTKRNLCIHTSLFTTHTDISKEWHPTKNNELKPIQFSAGSKQKVWWLCSNKCPEGCLHEWEATIGDRTSGYNCPYCANKKSCIHTSIITTHPDIFKEWHPTKNKDINPTNIVSGSHQKVWWLCPNKCPEGCLHEWEAVVKSRTYIGVGCVYCSKRTCCTHTSFKATRPELAKLWHPTKNNNLTPEMFSYGSGASVWWQCLEDKSHIWETKICSISTGTGCPFCNNKTEKKLYKYLKERFNNVHHNYKVNWCKSNTTDKHYPYDFFIPELNIIIELDGNQHFKQISNWNLPEDTLIRDVYKMKMAVDNNISLVRILQEDVYKYDDVWLDNNLLPELISYIVPTIIFIIKDNTINIYNKHIELLKNNTV